MPDDPTPPAATAPLPAAAGDPGTAGRTIKPAADRAADRAMRLAADPAGLDARLRALDNEWDIERVLEANAVVVSLLGSGIGILRRRHLIALGLPAAVAAFVLQHAIRGVRPPESLLRRLGFRSGAEIARERATLIALRGAPLPPAARPTLAAALAGAARRRLRR